MANYQNAAPPSSLFPGDVGFGFNNETFPGSAQAGSQFAIPSYAGQPDSGTSVRWQSIFWDGAVGDKLGTAGFPPVDFPEAPKQQMLPRVRKRSWHQIQAWRRSGAERDAEDNAGFVGTAKVNGPVPHS
jgi:hypothetical protein